MYGGIAIDSSDQTLTRQTFKLKTLTRQIFEAFLRKILYIPISNKFKK